MIPNVISTGVLNIAGKEIRIFNLDNGQRVIDRDSLIGLFLEEAVIDGEKYFTEESVKDFVGSGLYDLFFGSQVKDCNKSCDKD